MIDPKKYPWPTCTEGHDLRVEGAWIYRSSNYRECRLCAQGFRKSKKPKQNFSLGPSFRH